MKTLLIVRHAKALEGEPGKTDFDRKLSERGKKDAGDMARKIRGEGIKIDAFVSSPAKRAKRTARAFAEEYKQTKQDIQLREKLYNAPASHYHEVVSEMSDKHSSAAVFGHNPGISDFANQQLKGRIIEMPTCAVYAVQANVDSWKDFGDAEKQFVFFEYPGRAFEGISD